MATFEYKSKSYEIDDEDFLISPARWDEDFAEGMAPRAGIHEPLTPAHREVIGFIRTAYSKNGKCPMVHETCRALGLRGADLSRLFPAGYLRGACKLAGLTYRAEQIDPSWLPKQRLTKESALPVEQRVYRVDVRGFLVDSSEWDEDFALFKSREMKMPGNLTEKHWQIVRYLREQYAMTGRVPTVFQTCADNRMEIDELGELFPDGYHRGAVKLAGLRAI